MKKVVLVYDNLLHKPKLHNLTSFNDSDSYNYEDVFIRKFEDIYNVFIESNPDIYILNVDFSVSYIIQMVNNIKLISKKEFKLIIISSNTDFRNKLFKSKIPDRIFPNNIATDVLVATINELSNKYILENKSLYVELINQFELKPYSPTTEHFFVSLKIARSNPLLLSGHINNIYYTVSKTFNVSIEAARKSIYRVIDSAKCSSNHDYICSIFGNNSLNDISPSRFLEIITWKFINDNK